MTAAATCPRHIDAPGISLWDHFSFNGRLSGMRRSNAVARPSKLLDWREVVYANLKDIAKLKAGWNGPGSVAIDVALIYRAYRLLNDALDTVTVYAVPYLVPCNDGSIQIEWHRYSAELEFRLTESEPPSAWLHNHDTGAEIECLGDEAIDLLFRSAPRLAAIDRNDIDVPPPEARDTLSVVT